ncbi:MAG: DUF58 domain-containing protein [Candidatus Hydrogenedentes bacterium]|nr:DUF58 domain-containing protein [Candidatus Hydrogenedentota bacterium]
MIGHLRKLLRSPYFRNRSVSYRVLHLARNFWIFSLTPGGKIFVFCLLLSASVGSVSIDIPIYNLFNLFAAGWLVTAAAAYLFRPALELEGDYPDHATAGEPIRLHFRIHNPRNRPAYDIGLFGFGIPRQLDVHDVTTHVTIGADDAEYLSLELLPHQRGLYGPLGVRAYTSYPNHLFRIPCSRSARGSLLVYPHFQPLVDLRLQMGRRLQPGGIALTSNIGESMEYIGNREYRYGDPIKQIDFKAWARLAKPAVREYQEEYFCRVGLVIDTFIEPGARRSKAGYDTLEAAISICAAIADVLARGEYIIDVFAAGSELYVFRAGRHTMHFDHVLEVLSCVESCRENPFHMITPALAEELGSVSALICVLLDWDESRMEMVHLAQEMGCSIKVVLIRNSEPSSPFEDASIDFQQLRVDEVRSGNLEYL